MTDFWRSCGYHLLAHGADGRLGVTDDFLRAYLYRPELAPVETSCAAERALHRALLGDPRREVGEAEVAAIADPDARENYGVLLRFRAQLLGASSLEATYAGLFARDVTVPPLFIDQLVQVILRNILRDSDDAFELRAAELFFRRQKVSVDAGAIMLADAEIVEMHALSGGFGDIGRLLVGNQTAVRTIDLDVLGADNGALYFMRDERHDFVLRLNAGQPGSAAFCRVLERWIAHFHQVAATIRPVREIDDADWVWHVGLDAEASAILNDIYNGQDVEEERVRRIVGLFRADFHDPADLRPELVGKPIFLGLAMSTDNVVRMKPQNLLVNLPLARRV